MTKPRLSCFRCNVRRKGALGGQQAAGKEGTEDEWADSMSEATGVLSLQELSRTDVAHSQGRRSWSRLNGM